MAADDKQIGGQHYLTMPLEPWAVIDSWPLEQRIGFYRGNAIKYVLRMGSKDQASQEIKKAIHYLEKLQELLEALEANADVTPSNAAISAALSKKAFEDWADQVMAHRANK